MLFASAVNKRLFSTSTALRQYPFLKTLGLAETNPGVYRGGEWVNGSGPTKVSINPHNNEEIAAVKMGSASDFDDCIAAMDADQARWMSTPMPQRGEIIRQLGDELRTKKCALGSLISLEMGKIKTEGDGEV